MPSSLASLNNRFLFVLSFFCFLALARKHIPCPHRGHDGAPEAAGGHRYSRTPLLMVCFESGTTLPSSWNVRGVVREVLEATHVDMRQGTKGKGDEGGVARRRIRRRTRRSARSTWTRTGCRLQQPDNARRLPLPPRALAPLLCSAPPSSSGSFGLLSPLAPPSRDGIERHEERPEEAKEAARASWEPEPRLGEPSGLQLCRH